MKYVNVVIENKGRYTDQFFTYRCKDEDELAIEVGSIVFVPFGKNNKLKTAYVFEDNVIPDCDPEVIKEIDSVDSVLSLSREIISTVKWMKSRYGITFVHAIKCFLPRGKKTKEGKEKEPYKGEKGEIQNIENLTEEQKSAVQTINDAIDNDRQENFLIHGVTSSGKTEVYMQAIAEALLFDKTAIMLVPEIALTEQTVERFIGRFGKDTIAVLHSKLTERERFDEWMRIRSGEVKIVIGARIGVFAPLENIGVIILDEEHEATYKSDMTPKYDTVDIALKRLMAYDGVLILGSATPSVVSYQRAREGIYTLIELKERYNRTPLPKVELVDMREELKSGNTTVLSDRLYRQMKQNLEDRKQIILFLNRRGYSTFISCRECGQVMKCPECNISLTYHKRENAAICHYCGKKFNIPEVCPDCGSRYIKYFGAGTEQVEEFTRKMFPEYTVSRLDLDTATNRREIKKIIRDFSKGNTDILIGTQLVAKGLDFQNVGLVGVISADVSLNIPDYRSTERTFQLVTQVAGRAGRGDEEGLVVVQSYTPDNFALIAASHHNYTEFFEQEIIIRKLMDYPPYTDLIVVEFTGEDEDTPLHMAEMCKEYLIRCKIEGNGNNIFSPKLSYHFKGKNSVRYHIMIKCPKGYRNKYIHYIQLFVENMVANRCKCSIVIDVNPYGTL